MFAELKSLPYEQRLDKLGLWTLEERRNRAADLLEVFKLQDQRFHSCLLDTFLY